MLTILKEIRSRLVEDLGIKEHQMRAILSQGKGLMKSKPSFLLNVQPNAVARDADGSLDYATVVGKPCKFGLCVHVHSVFQHEDKQYSLQLKVCRLQLLEKPEEVKAVEQIDMSQLESAEVQW